MNDDLWVTASRDTEAEDLERCLTGARVAAASLWPFLAVATSEAEYNDRKALVADRIEHVATNAAGNDLVLFGVVHSSLLTGFDEDFRMLHAARIAKVRKDAADTALFERLGYEGYSIPGKSAAPSLSAEVQEELLGLPVGSDHAMQIMEAYSRGWAKAADEAAAAVLASRRTAATDKRAREIVVGDEIVWVPEYNSGPKNDIGKVVKVKNDWGQVTVWYEGNDVDGAAGAWFNHGDPVKVKDKTASHKVAAGVWNGTEKALDSRVMGGGAYYEDDNGHILGGIRRGVGVYEGQFGWSVYSPEGTFAPLLAYGWDRTFAEAQAAVEGKVTASRRMASTYCPTHGVYVGEGNQEQHDHCKTEQRESKDSALIPAWPSVFPRKTAGIGPVGISQEATGDLSRTWVVRQGEDFLGAFASEAEARASAEERGFTVLSARKTAEKYRAEFAGIGEGTWSRNNLDYDTPEEAKAAAEELSQRWFGFDVARVVPVSTPDRESVDLADSAVVLNFRTGSRRTADVALCDHCGNPGQPYTYKGQQFNGLIPNRGERLCSSCADVAVDAEINAPVGWAQAPASEYIYPSSPGRFAARKHAAEHPVVKAIAIYPDKRVEDVTISRLEDGQAIVQGLIEPVTLKDGSTMYVNEEGLYKFTKDDVNWIAADVASLGGRPEFMFGRPPLLGPVYITGPLDDEGYDTDVTDTARRWVQRVKHEAGGPDWKKNASRKTADEGPTWSKPCERCGATVERWRGEGDVSCSKCNAQYNAGGQRLRDDWAGNASNWDDDVDDMEGFERQQLRQEFGARRRIAADEWPLASDVTFENMMASAPGAQRIPASEIQSGDQVLMIGGGGYANQPDRWAPGEQVKNQFHPQTTVLVRRGSAMTARRRTASTTFPNADKSSDKYEKGFAYGYALTLSIPGTKQGPEEKQWTAAGDPDYLGGYQDGEAAAFERIDQNRGLRASRKTAWEKGVNPFAKKDDKAAVPAKPKVPAVPAAPAVPAEDPAAAAVWTCPACQATDAYTQAGKDLQEALDASEPIKCGACGQIDQTGGQPPAPDAGGQPAQPVPPASPAGGAQQPPKKKPVASRRRVAGMWDNDRQEEAARVQSDGVRSAFGNAPYTSLDDPRWRQALQYMIDHIGDPSRFTADDLQALSDWNVHEARMAIEIAQGKYTLDYACDNFFSFKTASRRRMAEMDGAPGREVWAKDFDKYSEALKPWVMTDQDGWQGISPDAPQDLLRPYQALMQMGYANGYLASRRTAAPTPGEWGQMSPAQRRDLMRSLSPDQRAEFFGPHSEPVFPSEPESVNWRSKGYEWNPGYAGPGGEARDQSYDDYYREPAGLDPYDGSRREAYSPTTRLHCDACGNEWSTQNKFKTSCSSCGAEESVRDITAPEHFQDVQPIVPRAAQSRRPFGSRRHAASSGEEYVDYDSERWCVIYGEDSSGWGVMVVDGWYSPSSVQRSFDTRAEVDVFVQGIMRDWDAGVLGSLREGSRRTASENAAVRHTAPGGGAHPPYKVQERDGKFVVVNGLGEVKGTHDTKEKARAQQSALYVATSAKRAVLESGREARAELIAMYNPPQAIEGWATGSDADGDTAGAEVYRRALEIQQEWLDGSRRQATSNDEAIWARNDRARQLLDELMEQRRQDPEADPRIRDGRALRGLDELMEQMGQEFDGSEARSGSRRQGANPYAPTSNPYIAEPPVSPGMPDDALDGTPNNLLTQIEPPRTTRPRQKPNGAPANNSVAPVSAPEKVTQGFASRSMPHLHQER